MPSRPLFFDTVTVANFALADALHLLVDRYGKRCVLTAEVLGEIAAGVTAGRLRLMEIENLISSGHLGETALTAEERRTKLPLLQNLGSGEASCIACVVHRGGVVATDDRAARLHCMERSLAVTGTIGVLMALCRDSVLSMGHAGQILKQMIEQGFYSPVQTIHCLM